MTFINSTKAFAPHFQNNFGVLEIANRVLTVPGITAINLGFSLSAGVFTVHGADGTALAYDNPAYVTLQDKSSPGLNKIYRIEANQSFTDDSGSSTIIGNLFGMTTGVAVTVDVPFFLYAVGNDAEDTISFMISRIPHRVVAPAAGNIGVSGSAVASTQGSFFALESPTVGDYDGNPCTVIGAFRMRMSAANDWTVQTLGTAQPQDGIGQFFEDFRFSVPTQQQGAAAGKYFADNGGTAPAWSDTDYRYKITRDGNVSCVFISTNRTAGAGAVTALCSKPFVSTSAGSLPTGSLTGSFALGTPRSSTTSLLDFIYQNAAVTGALANSDVGAGFQLIFSSSFQASVS